MEKALLIKSPHIEKILSGIKTWEMRSTATRIRGKIGLVMSGSGKIYGSANLVDCIGPLSPDDKLKSQHLHQISPERLLLPEVAKYKYAWVLQDVEKFPIPRAYAHPSGAVIWVNLE